MKLDVIFSAEALNDFESILLYFVNTGSYTIAENIEFGISSHIELLSKNPKMGHFDPLIDRSDYMIFVSVNYKIIYQVEGDKMIIIRIFDSRQDPAKLNP